ncbi:hypothetical protein MAUB_19090 [Mycolicibacterium aubagnense]|uniref:Uncharacterized protein n=2 Tax=Mycolicibacterium aubagnense TaxID=319707 RepID=A0ABN5YQF5_9MYCO|nr:hypothetical protein C1S80_21350 [Mycolicibacterium aubagnense]BBX84036.1 hypothetical protein MAUB_19090 [Mycolicibacterium aubagnense]
MTLDLMAAPRSADQTPACGERVADRAVTPSVTAHLPVLLVGLRWLFDTEQPAGAVQCPAGDSLPSAGGRAFRFIPADRDGRAALGIAVTTGIAGDAIGGHEAADFIDLLEGMGEEVLAINSVAAGSFYVLTLARPAHPTLRSAVVRYRAQYLEDCHTSPFGPARPVTVVNAVSARDLQRQAAISAAEQNSKQSPGDAGVHWMDRFGGRTTIAVTGTELCLAMQA